MFNKSQGVTVLITLTVLYAVHNFAALAPVKKLMNFDQ
jgi:hypothetical protein